MMDNHSHFLSVKYTDAQTPTLQPPEPSITVSPSLAIILVCLLTAFLLLACLSIYIRLIIERRLLQNFPHGGGRWQQEAARGLDPVVMDTFPTFKYSEVRQLKIGSVALECAVCLNEFDDDDETLRLLPKCSHVFHCHCVDAWLVSHVTCPVCRANLVPKPGEFYPIKTLNHDSDSEPGFTNPSPEIVRVADDLIIQSPDAINFNQNCPFRPPNNEMFHLPVQPEVNFERFTLTLPDEVRNRLMNSSLNRTKSCVVFSREGSSSKGFRTSSGGTGRGRSYFSYERFDKEGGLDRSGLTMTPSYLSRSGSMKGWLNSVKSPFDRLFGRVDKDNIGERSIDGLRQDGHV